MAVRSIQECDSKGSGDDNGIESVTVMSYNVDGLNQYDLMLRTHACIDLILQQNADIVMLQEVIPETQAIFSRRLSEAYIDHSCIDSSCTTYFTMAFVKKTQICTSSSRQPFYRSHTQMGRDILKVCVRVGDRPLYVTTSHLESTQSSSPTRCEQLAEIYDCHLMNSREPAIFCGDTNLSFNRTERKLDEVLALGHERLLELDDAYVVSGAKNSGGLSSTWRRRMSNGKIAQCRFDRFFSNKQHISVRSVHDGGFVLVGREPAAGTTDSEHSGYDTPSDHFGVFVTYDVHTPRAPSASTKTVNDARKCESPMPSNSSSMLKYTCPMPGPKKTADETELVKRPLPQIADTASVPQLSRVDLRIKRLKYFSPGNPPVDTVIEDTSAKLQSGSQFQRTRTDAKKEGCSANITAIPVHTATTNCAGVHSGPKYVTTPESASTLRDLNFVTPNVSWTCHACTFDNTSTHLERCAICETPRVNSAAQHVTTIE
eukprot:m.1084672 g.1084672  ORF g.1084672 m.1084672 type:complete len:487 (+) comp24274_c0_seq5:281-1741(+)